CRKAKLLDSVCIQTQNWSGNCASCSAGIQRVGSSLIFFRIINVNTVKRDIRLIHSTASYVTVPRYSRPEAQQRQPVTIVQWLLLALLTESGVAEACVRRIHL